MGLPVWKPVVNYEGLYEVSSDGRVRSLFRYKKELKPSITRNGYATVELFKNKIGKRLLVHRIVAMAFILNENCLPEVNHIDENKLNNDVSNLVWMSKKENMNWGTRTQRQIFATDYSTQSRKEIARANGKRRAKKVIQLSKDGAVICVYKSGKEASLKTGVNSSHIMECCKQKRKSAGGYIWLYKKEE